MNHGLFRGSGFGFDNQKPSSLSSVAAASGSVAVVITLACRRREKHALDAKYVTKRNPSTHVLVVAASWNSKLWLAGVFCARTEIGVCRRTVVPSRVTNSTKVRTHTLERRWDDIIIHHHS